MFKNFSHVFNISFTSVTLKRKELDTAKRNKLIGISKQIDKELQDNGKVQSESGKIFSSVGDGSKGSFDHSKWKLA